jgi:serine/threonine protein kinase
MSLEVFADRYQLNRVLGCGSFGTVYEAFDILERRPVALKVHAILLNGAIENRIAEMLSGNPGFPTVYQSGVWQNLSYLVMQLLGSPLSAMEESGPATLGTVLEIANQVITRIETFHAAEYVHRDIKPANFCFGEGCMVYMIDFGLCKPYVDSETGGHVPLRELCKQTGNPTYASVNSHLGYEQSRRDDVEAAMYMFIHLLRGTLPWCNLEAEYGAEARMIAHTKLTTSIDVTCTGCPPEFAEILRQIRFLKYEEKPDYDGYRRTLAGLAEREGKALRGPLVKGRSAATLPPVVMLPRLSGAQVSPSPIVVRRDRSSRERIPISGWRRRIPARSLPLLKR